MANITYLPIRGTIKIGLEKVIAFNTQNKESIKNAYTNDPTIVSTSTAVSNKDLLSQSFNIPSIETTTTPEIPLQTEKKEETQPIENTVSLIGIPTTQNSQKLEDNPVNMNMETNITPLETPMDSPITNINEVTMDPLNGLQDVIPNTGLNIDPLPESNENISLETIPNPLENISNIAIPDLNIVENNVLTPASDFQVSSAPNIFDQPLDLGISQNEINLTDKTNLPENNESFSNIIIPGQEPKTEEITAEKENTTNSTVIENISGPISDNSLLEEIEIEKENAELFEKLAKNSRKKAELLEKRINEETQNNNESGPSASDLFNSNGTLNDNVVLDKMPSIENIA